MAQPTLLVDDQTNFVKMKIACQLYERVGERVRFLILLFFLVASWLSLMYNFEVLDSIHLSAHCFAFEAKMSSQICLKKK
uniref:Uncharacterized protein n=1 Tax=Romanomermis culicivorax TaxID=13658 RepID=A0A915J3B4_ROMCU